MNLVRWFRQWREWVADQEKLRDLELEKEVVRVFGCRIDKIVAARDIIEHVRRYDRHLPW